MPYVQGARCIRESTARHSHAVLLLATLQTSMMRLAALVGQDFIEELFTIMNGYELVGCLVGWLVSWCASYSLPHSLTHVIIDRCTTDEACCSRTLRSSCSCSYCIRKQESLYV